MLVLCALHICINRFFLEKSDFTSLFTVSDFTWIRTKCILRMCSALGQSVSTRSNLLLFLHYLIIKVFSRIISLIRRLSQSRLTPSVKRWLQERLSTRNNIFVNFCIFVHEHIRTTIRSTPNYSLVSHITSLKNWHDRLLFKFGLRGIDCLCFGIKKLSNRIIISIFRWLVSATLSS